jgi:hypothetical protein
MGFLASVDCTVQLRVHMLRRRPPEGFEFDSRKLQGGVRARILVDGVVLKSETVKHERAFFQTLLTEPSGHLEVGVFTAPRVSLRERQVGANESFGAQLYAKRGVVDGAH